MKLRKIIDKTYGKGSFVEFAENGLPKSKWEMEADFNWQFAKTEEIEVLGGKIKVADVRPENPKSEVPVLIAPGWGENQDVFADSLKTLYLRNKRALSLTHSRHGGNAETDEGKSKDKYPVSERIAKYGLYLPSGLALKDWQIAKVCQTIRKYV